MMIRMIKCTKSWNLLPIIKWKIFETNKIVNCLISWNIKFLNKFFSPYLLNKFLNFCFIDGVTNHYKLHKCIIILQNYFWYRKLLFKQVKKNKSNLKKNLLINSNLVYFNMFEFISYSLINIFNNIYEVCIH